MSTTGRSASECIEQPAGGHILPKPFEVKSLGEGGDALNPGENVSPDLIGAAAYCMAHFMLGMPVKVAFGTSLSVARRIGGDAFAFKAHRFIDGINKDLDDSSIINAVKLSGFDVRFLTSPESYQPIEEISPNEATIQNVRMMVERYLHFFSIYGSISLMPDTLWRFEVSKPSLMKERARRLLIDWRKGLCSSHAWQFWNVERLGVYNPLLNEVYQIEVGNIPKDVIAEVDQDVIDYSD